MTEYWYATVGAIIGSGITIWLSASHDILESELIADINWHRYQLDHITNKLSLCSITMASALLDGIETAETEGSEAFGAHAWRTHQAGIVLLARLSVV